MWFTALIPLLSGIFGENGPLGQYLKTKAATVQAAADLAMQVQKDKMALSGIMAQAAVESEKNKLAATSQTFKNSVFFMLSAPIIVTMISPVHGREIFSSLNIVPVAYMQMYFAIIGIIWGLPIAGNVVTMIMTGLQSAFDARMVRQVSKIQAVGEANTITVDQAIKLAYDVQRKLSPNGMLSQQQVDKSQPIIKQALDIIQTSVNNKDANGAITVNTGDK